MTTAVLSPETERGQQFSQASSKLSLAKFRLGPVTIFKGDALKLYPRWPSPVVIISDGPYGVAGFPGDDPTPASLPGWYEPHIKAWSQFSTPLTTLWFWNTELGWAKVHSVLEKYGWQYRACHIWDKGIGHIAGNANSATLRKLPIVTEVCVQYVKEARFNVNGRAISMAEWLRHEWGRTGTPFSRTNKVCGVKDAATRKYFTTSWLWYFPPPGAFQKLAEYANEHGKPEGRPYFSVDGKRPLTGEEWKRMRSKFNCEVGTTNVWSHPPVRGPERLKNRLKCLHSNQKPLKLVELTIRLSSDPEDVVWEPFGGLCTGAIASYKLNRRCYGAEISGQFFKLAVSRLKGFVGELYSSGGTGNQFTQSTFELADTLS